MIVPKMTHAKESGNPKISGVGEEKSVYPGHTKKELKVMMTRQNKILLCL